VCQKLYGGYFKTVKLQIMPRRGRSPSRSDSRSSSRSASASSGSGSERSSSRSLSPVKRKPGKKPCKRGFSPKKGIKVSKGYKIIAENIQMIAKDARVAYCRPCANGVKGKMTPLDEDKSIFVKMCNRESYAIVGPCSKCGRKRCCFVKKVAGYA